jgi:hypothetical protein
MSEHRKNNSCIKRIAASLRSHQQSVLALARKEGQ